MSETLRQLVTRLFPQACEWAESKRQVIEQTGRALTDEENSLAVAVGVSCPSLVRVLLVPAIPIPDHPQLCEACKTAGILNADTTGLTLFHGIYLKELASSRQLLAHELRHVAQYESHRTLTAYLAVYFDQISHFGYDRAPYEIDANVAAALACA